MSSIYFNPNLNLNELEEEIKDKEDVEEPWGAALAGKRGRQQKGTRNGKTTLKWKERKPSFKENLLITAADLLLPDHPGEDASWEELDKYYQTVLPKSLTLYEMANNFGLMPDMGSQDFRLMINYLSGIGGEIPYGSQEDVDLLLNDFHHVYGNAPKSGRLLSSEPHVPGEYPVGGLWGGHRAHGDTQRFLDTSGKRGQKNVWYPSENPEYPAEDGWEFLMYDVPYFSSYHNIYVDRDWLMHNMLGMESTVRRKPVEGGYEYQIVEPWDIEFGEDAASMTRFSKNPRQFPDWQLDIAEKIFPDFVSVSEWYEDNLQQPALEDTQKPGQYNYSGPEFRWAQLQDTEYVEHYLDEYAKSIDIIGKSLLLGKESSEWPWNIMGTPEWPLE